MTQKISRQDLKRNDLAATMNRTVDYVTGHRKGVTEAGAIVAVVAVLVGGFFLYRAFVERSAGKQLSEALAVMDTPLASEQPGAGKTFASAAERRAQADKLLQAAASHASTPSGRAAQVILAADGADKPGTAVDVFEKAARQSRSESAAAAEIDAAKALAAQGKTHRGRRPPQAGHRIADVGGAEGRAPLRARRHLRAERGRGRCPRHVPAADHGLPELSLPRRRPTEGPAVVTLLHDILIASAALSGVCLALFAVNAATMVSLSRQAPAGSSARRPPVSTVVPARDEERGIEGAVRSHLSQDYENLEVIVVDDRSSDRTPEILARLAKEDARLTVVTGVEPPDGWLGKPHALFEGTSRASGEILLLADADVRYEPSAVSDAVALMESRGFDFLALFPASR